MCADAVVAAFNWLLQSKALAVDLPERCLAEYSDEDLDDMALDNPKVVDYLAAIRAVLRDGAKGGGGATLARISVTSRADEAICTQHGACNVTTADLGSCGGTCNKGTTSAAGGPREGLTYSSVTLLDVRRSMLQDGLLNGMAGSALPCWRTESVVVTNAGQTQHWEAAANQRDKEVGRSGTGGEWRREQKKNNDANASAAVQRVIEEDNANLYHIAKHFASSDFAVVVQPGMDMMSVPDWTYLSRFDCFHPALVTHQQVALALWTNLFQPIGKKTREFQLPVNIYCPTD